MLDFDLYLFETVKKKLQILVDVKWQVLILKQIEKKGFSYNQCYRLLSEFVGFNQKRNLTVI